MDNVDDQFWIWVAKSFGAAAGSAVSLAHMLPANHREAGLRFASGLVVGLVFGGTVGLKIIRELKLEELVNPVESTLIGATIASLCAWWIIGALFRLINAIGRKSTQSNRKF